MGVRASTKSCMKSLHVYEKRTCRGKIRWVDGCGSTKHLCHTQTACQSYTCTKHHSILQYVGWRQNDNKISVVFFCSPVAVKSEHDKIGTSESVGWTNWISGPFTKGALSCTSSVSLFQKSKSKMSMQYTYKWSVLFIFDIKWSVQKGVVLVDYIHFQDSVKKRRKHKKKCTKKDALDYCF